MKQFLADSLNRLDVIVWCLVLAFFVGSAALFGGNISMAFLGASAIIFEMLLISIAVEIIIESLKNTKGIGTLTGFITNGPEAITLIVGLAAGDVIFAASTPLGSNFMNPILLVIALLLCSSLIPTLKTHPRYTLLTLISSILLAGSFFLIPKSYYIAWTIIALTTTVPLFILRPKENEQEEDDSYSFSPKTWLVPAILLLTISGYFLDPVVSFTAEHSHAPKSLIGFLVLATLTSWPEFKSCLALLKRQNYLGAILNIVVSNITNIWLAIIGVTIYLLSN